MTTGDEDDRNAPPVVGSEKATLVAFLGYLRTSVARKLDGLSEDDARRSPVASGTSLLGIVKHLASVETYWAERRLAGRDVVVDADAFALRDEDTIDSVRKRYRDATTRADDVIRACDDLEQPLARGRHGLTLRWMLTHLVEETA